jgi:hypothetical protein
MQRAAPSRQCEASKTAPQLLVVAGRDHDPLVVDGASVLDFASKNT